MAKTAKILCAGCGKEITVTFDNYYTGTCKNCTKEIDIKPFNGVIMKPKASCDNCGMGSDCVNYYAEDCGPNHKLWIPIDGCSCGNPEYGFDCVCKHIFENAGDTDYSCEFCGLYTASKPKCNKCEAE